ncbi:MAG: dihydrolipoyl dehydrogenase [Phycisphaeraceae bacterium]
MAENNSFDLVVIGGGPGGYVGAIRAAQLGLKVACVERDALGGVCLNWGCIPTKALLAGAEMYQRLKTEGDAWGIQCDNLRHDWEKVIARSRQVASTLNRGIGGLFKKNRITHFEGHAHIPEPGVVEVYGKLDTERKNKPQELLKAKNILVATGAGPRALPGTEFDGEKIICSKDAMSLPTQPGKLLIIGAGAIGMEFAYFYNAFGTEVTVIEMLDRVLPVEDREASAAVAKAFVRQGVKLYPGHKTLSVQNRGDGIEAVIAPVEDPHAQGAPAASEKSYGAAGEEEGKAKNAQAKKDGDEITLEADKVLVAIGVQGRYDGLFDDSLGVEIERHHIKVDKPTYATSVPGIYAIGDVIGPPWLAHVASEEAIACVERIAGVERPEEVDYESIPGCTYCQPQVASIGLTEEACKEQGLEYEVARFPFQASGKAQAMNATEGFVKLITGKPHGEILGCHMVGETVTEMVAELGLARKLEATSEELIATMHAHPTLSEAIHEAALGTEKRMIHF